MTQLLPPKKEVALALLERSNVDVYLDPRARGVVVPPQFRKEPRLILKIGLNMPVPIPDLRVDEDSMSCTLSFNRSPFYCVVPWSAVFALVGEDGRGMVWPDDVPQELAVKVVEPAPESSRSSSSSRRLEPASPSAASSSGSGSGGRRAVRGSKLAEDSPSEARGSRAGRGAKKKTGKKEEARPMLVAVPSPSSRPGEPNDSPQQRQAELAAQAREGDRGRRPADAHDSTVAGQRDRPEPRDGVSAIPSSRSPSSPSSPSSQGARSSRIPPSAPPPGRPDGVRPKRELPPYLRVVK